MQANLDFCLKCGKDASNIETCECGSTTFAFGFNISLIDSILVCGCGSKVFKIVSDSKFSEFTITNYRCTKCDNLIGVQCEVDKFQTYGLEET